jgi:hypothetical protein
MKLAREPPDWVCPEGGNDNLYRIASLKAFALRFVE